MAVANSPRRCSPSQHQSSPAPPAKVVSPAMDGSEQDCSAGIAIIGMALRFPGAETPQEFWHNLCSSTESVRFFSYDELLSAGVPDSLLCDPGYVKASPVLDEVDKFDAAFFGYSPKEATLMDPQNRLLLEVSWGAF